MLSFPRSTRTLATALVVTALAAPGADARPTGTRPANAAVSPSSRRPTVTRTLDEGVDLGSVALGAGGASAVLMLTAAAALHCKRRRSHPR